MPRNRPVRLVYALIVATALILIGRNLVHRYLNDALVAAVKTRDLTAVQRLLARGADPNLRVSDPDFAGHPPILSLVYFNLTDKVRAGSILRDIPNANAEGIARLLIRHGARLQDDDFLIMACRAGDVALVRELLDHGVDPNSSGIPAADSAFNAALSYATGSATLFSPAQMPHIPEDKAEMTRRHEVSRQLVQLLREHGLHLTLTQAQEIGDAATVKQRVARNDTGTADDSYNAMYTAAWNGDLETIGQMLKHGVDPDLGNPVNPSLLDVAAGTGNLSMVKLLLAHGAKINLNRSTGSPLEWAITHRKSATVRYLLAQGADTAPQLKSNTQSYAPLLTEALHDLPEVVPDLLQHGAPVNLPLDLVIPGAPGQGDYNGAPHSPLMAAIFYAPEYEPVLVQAGAKIGLDRPIICGTAVLQKRLDLLPKLLAYGADINGTDFIHDTALTVCVDFAPGGVRTLLEHGANPNVLSSQGRTPLQEAVNIGNVELVRLLLVHGADVNIRAKNGHTALDWARRKNHPDIIALLQQAGAQE